MDPVDDVVKAWLSLPEVAERLEVPVAAVRRLIEDRDLVAVRRGERKVLCVPAGFLDTAGPLPALKGTFMVLADSGFDDEEIITWLHTPDASWPGGENALSAIRAGFKTEVRRRAMEEAI